MYLTPETRLQAAYERAQAVQQLTAGHLDVLHLWHEKEPTDAQVIGPYVQFTGALANSVYHAHSIFHARIPACEAVGRCHNQSYATSTAGYLAYLCYDVIQATVLNCLYDPEADRNYDRSRRRAETLRHVRWSCIAAAGVGYVHDRGALTDLWKSAVAVRSLDEPGVELALALLPTWGGNLDELFTVVRTTLDPARA